MNSCKRCSYKVKDGCSLLKYPMADDDYCSKFTSTLVKCELCGRVILRTYYYANKILCVDCFQKLGTCFGCVNCTTCEFNADTTMQHFIPKQERMGNMVMQTQIPNPELVEKTCKHCECWDTTLELCNRNSYNYCRKHKEGV